MRVADYNERVVNKFLQHYQIIDSFESGGERSILIGSVRLFEEMNQAMLTNDIKPVVNRVFEFNEAREAFKHMEAGAYFGKIVVRVE